MKPDLLNILEDFLKIAFSKDIEPEEPMELWMTLTDWANRYGITAKNLKEKWSTHE